MKAPTEMQIRAMSAEQRSTLRANAAKLGGPLGDSTVALIDSLRLPMSSGGMASDDPLYLAMREVVWSKEGQAAALSATAAGQPAMALVDPLIQAKMGARYGREQQGTVNAGFIVAELMRSLGYEKEGEGPLPPNCVAKTAARWRPKAKLK